jgi:hypothetical protein
MDTFITILRESAAAIQAATVSVFAFAGLVVAIRHLWSVVRSETPKEKEKNS